MRLSNTLKLGLLLFLPESVAKALGVRAFRLSKSVDVTTCLTGAMENLHCPLWIQLCMEIYDCLHFWQLQQQKRSLCLDAEKFAVTLFWNLKQNDTSLAEKNTTPCTCIPSIQFHKQQMPSFPL